MTNPITPEQFKAERSRLDMTIKEMADLLCVSTRAISYYESGERPVPLTICKLLYLIGRLDKKYGTIGFGKPTDRERGSEK